MRRLTNEEFQEKLKSTGRDVFTDDEYINQRTEMDFYCSKGHHWMVKAEPVMHGKSGCPYCSGNKPIIGETDLWTTRPDIAKLLKNPEDGHIYKECSNKDVEFICPNCGKTIVNDLCRVCKQGFSCRFCSDGISYPNKVMRNVLEQLNIEYIPEYKIGDCRRYYDFYVPQHKMIIEMHGVQHFTGWSHNKEDFIKQQENDEFKKQHALINGILHYIVIDCSVSDIDFISNNILNSELNKFYDLSVIDWQQGNKYASSSLLVEVSNLYNDGHTIPYIMDKLKISRSTVQVYLRRAEKGGLCQWDRDDHIDIILLNTKEIFHTSVEAAKAYNLKTPTNIRGVCKGQHKYYGLYPVTNEPLVWRDLDKYDENEQIDFMSLYNPCTAKLKNKTK